MTEQGKGPVIKKVIKKVSGGAHGGSWKVAYADFVTAMMAFFLLMWLLSMTEPEKKLKLAQYFRDFTIFSYEGAGLLDKELPKTTDKPTMTRPKNAYLPQTEGGNKSAKEKTTASADRPEINAITMKKRLKKILKVKMATFKSNLMITEEEQGIKIEIMSLEDDPLFELGGPEPTQTMKRLIKKLYREILSRISNNLIIEGHSDAIYYLNDKSTNWELSTNRALMVRRELENLGIDSDRFEMIAGYASKKLLIEDNPKDSRNRRVSITILFPRTGKEPHEPKIIKLENPV